MEQNPSYYQFIVEQPGIRLDKFVSENCPALSRSQAQKIIDDGLVTVNGVMEKASHKTESGERIEITIPPRHGAKFCLKPVLLKSSMRMMTCW